MHRRTFWECLVSRSHDRDSAFILFPLCSIELATVHYTCINLNYGWDCQGYTFAPPTITHNPLLSHSCMPFDDGISRSFLIALVLAACFPADNLWPIDEFIPSGEHLWILDLSVLGVVFFSLKVNEDISVGLKFFLHWDLYHQQNLDKQARFFFLHRFLLHL